MALAQLRTKDLMAALEATSRRQQRQVIAAARVMHSPVLGWTGGVFDLETLLEDPGFTIPKQPRRASEQIVAEVKASVLNAVAGSR